MSRTYRKTCMLSVRAVISMIVSILSGCSNRYQPRYWPDRDYISHERGIVTLRNEPQVAYIFNATSVTLSTNLTIIVNRTKGDLEVLKPDGSKYQVLPYYGERSYENGEEIQMVP